MIFVTKSFFGVAGLCAMVLGCATTKSSDAHERSDHPAIVRYCIDHARTVNQDASAKFTQNLAQALAVWRTEVCYTLSSEYEYSERERAEIRARRATVLVKVTSTAQRSALAAAGLSPGFSANGVVSGGIALRDVERLAAVPEVIQIEIEPKVHPL